MLADKARFKKGWAHEENCSGRRAKCLIDVFAPAARGTNLLIAPDVKAYTISLSVPAGDLTFVTVLTL